MENGFKHDHAERPGRKSNPCVGTCCHEDVPQHHHSVDGYVIHLDDLESLPVTNEEIALLQAFLHDEIQAILLEKDEGG